MMEKTPAGATGRGWNGLAGLSTPTDTLTAHRAQHLAQRHGLPLARAVLLAEHAFRNGGAG